MPNYSSALALDLGQSPEFRMQKHLSAGGLACSRPLRGTLPGAFPRCNLATAATSHPLENAPYTFVTGRWQRSDLIQPTCATSFISSTDTVSLQMGPDASSPIRTRPFCTPDALRTSWRRP